MLPEAAYSLALQHAVSQVERDWFVGITVFWTVWTPVILPFLTSALLVPLWSH